MRIPLEPSQSKDLWSIVMTCGRPYDDMLEDALVSLAQQTYRNFELVFVSNSMKTYTAVNKLCKTLEIGVRFPAAAHARNRHERFREGVRDAQGVYIGVLDSDDMLHPRAIEIASKSLKLFPNVHFFTSSHFAFIDGSLTGKHIKASPWKQTLAALVKGFEQRHFWGFSNDSDYWPRDFLYSTDPVEDYWAFACIARAAMPVLCIPHCLYAWRNWSGQYTRVNLSECVAMCERIQKALKRISEAQSPYWHMGDLVLAARMQKNMELIERLIPFDDEE